MQQKDYTNRVSNSDVNCMFLYKSSTQLTFLAFIKEFKSSQWVSVNTLQYFSILYNSHIFLFQALKLIHALHIVHWKMYKWISSIHLET